MMSWGSCCLAAALKQTRRSKPVLIQFCIAMWRSIYLQLASASIGWLLARRQRPWVPCSQRADIDHCKQQNLRATKKLKEHVSLGHLCMSLRLAAWQPALAAVR